MGQAETIRGEGSENCLTTNDDFFYKKWELFDKKWELFDKKWKLFDKKSELFDKKCDSICSVVKDCGDKKFFGC